MTPEDRDARSTDFDRELARAARSLVEEPLPPGTLAVAGVAVQSGARRALPRLRLVLIAILAAVALVIGPRFGESGGPGGSGGLRPRAAAALILRTAGWRCAPPVPSPRRTTPATGPPAATGLGPADSPPPAAGEIEICQAPAAIQPVVAAAIFQEDPAGRLVGVSIKADILGTSTGALEDQRGAALLEAVSVAFQSEVDAESGRRWVQQHLGASSPTRQATTIGGIPIAWQSSPTGGELIDIGVVTHEP